MVNIIKQKSVGTCEWQGVSFISCTVLFIGMVVYFILWSLDYIQSRQKFCCFKF